ncbi:MAG: hypothetical protein Q4D58_07045 [Synergistaceae bacterium]|nr:hypothetical protein [Synergistaceae bacterium]
MKLATIKMKKDGKEYAAFVIPRGFVTLERFNEEKRSDWPTSLDALLAGGQVELLNRWYMAGGGRIVENMSRRLITAPEEAELVGELYVTEDEA